MQGTEKGVIRMFGSLKKLFGGEEKDEKVIAAPVSGKAVPMSQVNDPTFSQEILGKGTACLLYTSLVIFIGDFVFGVSVAVGQLILGILLSTLIAVVYNFFIITVDYTRTEYVQFEDDDYYYYVKAVPKMNVSTPDVKVQKISSRKRSTRERNVY